MEQLNVDDFSDAGGRPNLPASVARRLRQDILSGRLAAGSRIDQDKVAGSLGVSRLPVREALINLEREGLVENIPRRGSYVVRLSPSDLLDQYEIFALVSGMAAGRAARRLTDGELAELRALVTEMKSSRDIGLQESANYRFHAIINKAAGSRRLAWLIRLLVSSVPRGYESGGWRLAAEHHANIVERLAARDEEGAAAAMRTHILSAGEVAVRALTESGFWNSPEELQAEAGY